MLLPIKTFSSFCDKISIFSSSEDDFHYSPTEQGKFFTNSTRHKKKSESRGKRNWRRALRLIKVFTDKIYFMINNFDFFVCLKIVSIFLS